jgi:hypothetical protein
MHPLVLLVLCWAIYIFSERRVSKISINYYSRNVVLYDTFHNLFPKVNTTLLTDWYSITLNLWYALIADNYHYFKYLHICSILLLLRVLSFSITILPDPSQKGHLKNKIIRTVTGGCSDLMFSSHTASSLIVLLLLNEEGNLRHKNIAFGLHFVMSFLMIISRNHYTIDVMYAYFVTFSILKLYPEILELF